MKLIKKGCLPAVCCFLFAASSGLYGATPTITTVAPEIVPAGASEAVLFLVGTNFASGATVKWQKPGASSFVSLTTTFVSSTRLKATLATADIATPGTAKVKVEQSSGSEVSAEKDVIVRGILYFPIFDKNADLFTGVALSNISTTTSFTGDNKVGFEAFKSNGIHLMAEVTRDVGAGTQDAKLSEEIFTALGNTDSGWFRVKYPTASADVNILKGFFLQGRNNLLSLDGVDVNDRLSTDLVFPLVAKDGSAESQVILVNPNPIAATLKFELWSLLGSNEPLEIRKLKVENVNLAARQRLEQTISEIFAGLPDLPTLFGGDAKLGQLYLRVTSDIGVFGFQTFPKRDSAKDYVALRGQDVSAESGTEIFYPHLAEGLGYETLLSIINVHIQNATASVKVEIVLDDGTSGSTVLTLSPKGIVRTRLKDLFPSVISGNKIQVGYVKATDQTTSSGSLDAKRRIMGSITFSNPFFGATAALPSKVTPSAKYFLSDVAVQNPQTLGDQAFLTGVGLLNPSSSNDASVTIKVFKKDGTKVGEKTITLKASERQAKLLQEFVPEVKDQVRGYIDISSKKSGTSDDLAIHVLELFGDWGLRKLAAVPAQ